MYTDSLAGRDDSITYTNLFVDCILETPLHTDSQKVDHCVFLVCFYIISLFSSPTIMNEGMVILIPYSGREKFTKSGVLFRERDRIMSQERNNIYIRKQFSHY